MSILLTKGGNINLSKVAPGMTIGEACCGWRARTTDGVAFDLDVMVALVGADGKLKSEKDFVYHRNLIHHTGSVTHSGDNRKGTEVGGKKVAESAKFDFTKLPADVDKAIVVINIQDADKDHLCFGMVKDAFVEFIDVTNGGTRVCNFDLGEDFSTEKCVIACEVYRNNGDWKLRNVGQGYATGIEGFIRDLGQIPTYEAQ